MRELVRCHRCHEALERKDAVPVDRVEIPEGEHWAWAHPACVPAEYESQGPEAPA